MLERNCQLTGKTFELHDAELEAYENFGIPLPNLSNEERFRRLAAFRPEKQFFLRSCDATGARLFSIYPKDTAFPVYSWDHWSSPDFDPLSYGQPFDFKRLFVEQLLELWRKVPRPAYVAVDSAKTRISHRVWRAENCFLVFDSMDVDRCQFSTALSNCAHCIDCYQVSNSRWCYETYLSEQCEKLRFGEYCTRCRESWFLTNCTDCSECLFCVNLEGKKHHVFNQPVTKEQYAQTLAELSLDAGPLLELAKNRFRDFLQLQPAPHIFADAAGANSGNYHRRSNNIFHSFEVCDSTNIINSRDVSHSSNCLDVISVRDSENIAQSVSIFGGQGLLNCVDCWDSVSDLAYCTFCRESSHLLGCVGLRGKEYCIFNQQYTREEYLTLHQKILKHLKDRSIWGTALPMSFSAHAYNHSAANEYMPLTKVPAKMMGFAWDDLDQPIRPSDLLGESDAPPEELFTEVPERLSGSLEELSRAVFICSVSGKPFQFSLAELESYRELGVAPPTHSFQQRYTERMSRLTPHQLFSRNCSITGKPLKTSFPPKWKQPVAEYNSLIGSSLKG